MILKRSCLLDLKQDLAYTVEPQYSSHPKKYRGFNKISHNEGNLKQELYKATWHGCSYRGGLKVLWYHTILKPCTFLFCGVLLRFYIGKKAGHHKIKRCKAEGLYYTIIPPATFWGGWDTKVPL